jgi:hemerythrin-like domain-containing protein
MNDPIAIWHAEHARFGRLLAVLEKQMAVFREGGEPNYGLMSEIIHYLRHYPDRYHHPREEVAFARLLKRDPTLYALIRRLSQEHRVIAVAGAQLLALLESVVNGAIVSRESVEAAAATYLDYYRRHLVAEERDILPSARVLLDTQDWEAVRQAVPPQQDETPGGHEVFAARYKALQNEISLTAA